MDTSFNGVDQHGAHPDWQAWADRLRRWGVQDLAAWFLEATSPLHLLGAQLYYIGQPWLDALFPRGGFRALANLLEDPDQEQAFLALLKEEHS